MKTKNFVSIVFAAVVLLAGRAQAGVIGVGNSGDISMQLGFAKNTAVSTLRHVTVDSLVGQSVNAGIVNFYRSCRQVMYVGALNTEFELVDSLDDTNGFHALARRINKKTILVSRRQLETLADNGTLTSSFLTAMVLHEVGHDCEYNGNPVGDRFDGLLDVLAQSLILESTNQTYNHERHMVLLQRIRKRQKVTIEHIPQKLKTELVHRYIDYIGDLAYVELSHGLKERPLPASRFFESLAASVFKSWSKVELSPFSPLHRFKNLIIKPPLKTKNFSWLNNGEEEPLTTRMGCLSKDVDGLETAICTIYVYWPEDFHDLARSIQIAFETNIFGHIKLTQIKPFKAPSQLVTNE